MRGAEQGDAALLGQSARLAESAKQLELSAWHLAELEAASRPKQNPIDALRQRLGLDAPDDGDDDDDGQGDDEGRQEPQDAPEDGGGPEGGPVPGDAVERHHAPARGGR